MEKKETKKATPKKVVKFRKNYSLEGVPVGKGTIVTNEHRKMAGYSDKLTE